MSALGNGSNRRSERAPLLGSDADLAAAAQRVRLANEARDEEDAYQQRRKRRGIISGILTFVFIAGLVLCWVFFEEKWEVSGDPDSVARDILTRFPVIVSFLLCSTFIFRVCNADGVVLYVGWTHRLVLLRRFHLNLD